MWDQLKKNLKTLKTKKKLFPVSANVRPAAAVFLTFLASKPGPVWRLTIQQNQQCIPEVSQYEWYSSKISGPNLKMQQKQQCIQDDSTDVEDVVLGNNAGEEEEELESATDGSIEIPGNMAYFQNRYPWLQISAPEKVQEDPPATICSNNFN